MAFFRKAGSIFLRSVSNHNSSRDVTISKPSIFQTIRWMSSSRVFVGGISFSTDNSSLEEAFRKYGEVTEARVIVDRETGRSRGFGFVTFNSAEEASAAIQALDQQELHGRQIRVAYANDRQRGFGGGFGGGDGYNRGYGGGGGGGYGSDYGGSYGGGGGGYGGNYNSGGGGGYNNNDGYGGSNYNSGVGSYGSAGGTNDGYDGQKFGATGGSDYFGSGGGGGGGGISAGEGGYDGFGDGLGKNSGGDSFGNNEGNNLVDGDDMDNYADRRN